MVTSTCSINSLFKLAPERSPEINALWGHEPDWDNNQPIITLVQGDEPPTGLFVGVGAILVGIVATFTFPFRTVFPLWGRPAFYLLLTLGSFLIVIELLSPKKTRDRYYELIWQTSHVDTWSKRILASFDEAFAVVFGKKHWSLRCFLGSVTVTAVSVFFLVVIPDILLAFFYSPTPFGHIIKVLGRLLGLFGLITAITFLFDFISLWWTRSLMTRVAHRGFGVIFLALILDFALTFTLGLLPGVATYQSLFAYFINNLDIYRTFVTQSAIEPFTHASVVTFVTGFFTSVWLWGQMAVVGTARGLSALKPIGQLLSELAVAKHPLSAAVGLSGFGTTLLLLSAWLTVRLAPIDNPVQTTATQQAQMVKIKAGEFTMGCAKQDDLCDSDESPRHRVHLDTYWMDRTEVTVGAYTACMRAGACDFSAIISPSCGWLWDDDYPMNCVNWFQAKKFCEWRNQKSKPQQEGRIRLPTEAEWEKAARGENSRVYPWGDEAPDCRRANYWGCRSWLPKPWESESWLSEATNTYLSWVPQIEAVGSHPMGNSPYNAADMAGNVWEWVEDCYGRNIYSERNGLTKAPRYNPESCSSGGRVVRGGSFDDPGPRVRASGRNWNVPADANWIGNFGFRCAFSQHL